MRVKSFEGDYSWVEDEPQIHYLGFENLWFSRKSENQHLLVSWV